MKNITVLGTGVLGSQIAFQTAYMKTYHPVEYMAALLTFEMGSTEKVVEYIDECRRMNLPDGSTGIKVLPPDVNVSDLDFTPVYVTETTKAGKRRKAETKTEGTIRFGLAAVRGVGSKAVEAIINERREKGDFTSLYDFCERVDLRSVNRSTIECLVKSGAYSTLNGNRAQLLAIVERAIEMGQQTQNDRRSGQMNMFAAAATTSLPRPADPLPDLEELPSAELLKYEKELLGFYLTSHPLTEHQATLDRYMTASTREASNCSEGTEVMIGCMLTAVRSKVAKSGRSAGQRWAILVMEDLEGTIEGMCFAESYAAITAKYPDALNADRIVFVKGKVDRKRETPSIMVQEVIPIEDAVNRLTTGLVLKLDSSRHDAAIVPQIKPLLTQHAGRLPIYVQVLTDERQTVTMKMNAELGIKPSIDLKENLERLLGNDAVQLIGPGSKRIKRIEQQRLFKEEEQPPDEPIASDEALAARLDAEMEEAE